MPVQTMNGINPLDPAALEHARTLAEKAEQLKRENAPPENLVEADDLSDLPVIAGFECVRPISAGVFAVLQLIRHPFVTGEESAPEDEFSDALVFLFLLLADTTERKLVNLARLGTDAMRDAAIEWSFRLLPGDLGKLMGALPEFLNRFSETMDVYSGNGADAKKKSATG